MGAAWRVVLKAEFSKPYFTKLVAFLEEEHGRKTKVFPPGTMHPCGIFRCCCTLMYALPLWGS